MKPLTRRQKEIVCQICRGKTNPEIALILGLSPLTAKNHVQKILDKTGTVNRVSLAVYALRNGIITLGLEIA